MGAAGRSQEGGFTSGEESEKVGWGRDMGWGGMRETPLHGNDYFMVGTFAQCGSRLLLIHGHTHRPDVWKAGLHLIIRQGEVCRHLTGTSTVAIVDTEKRGAEIVEL